jgi:HSP20 family protein
MTTRRQDKKKTGSFGSFLYEGGTMTIVRWDPFRELEDMSERLNRVFARPSVRNTGKENLTVADWMPTVDISETEGEYLIKAELPEVRKEDVKVTVENGVLTLQGERRQEKDEKGKRFHRVERSYGSFVRSFSLPESVDDGAVKAEYKDGVLNLHLPKSEKVKPKAIDVKVA